jgi:hypothetical protein
MNEHELRKELKNAFVVNDPRFKDMVDTAIEAAIISERKKCPKCGGTGSFNYGDFHVQNTKRCNECKGTGWVY